MSSINKHPFEENIEFDQSLLGSGETGASRRFLLRDLAEFLTQEGITNPANTIIKYTLQDPGVIGASAGQAVLPDVSYANTLNFSTLANDSVIRISDTDTNGVDFEPFISIIPVGATILIKSLSAGMNEYSLFRVASKTPNAEGNYTDIRLSTVGSSGSVTIAVGGDFLISLLSGVAGSGGGISDLSSFTTNELAEGNINLYYTEIRAEAAASRVFSNVDNTADIDKPVSRAQLAEINTKAEVSANPGGTGNAFLNTVSIDGVNYDIAGLPFTEAEQTKLFGIEVGATTDQTPGEIKFAYESNPNTNPFEDAERTKLAGIEANATADQTPAEIRASYLSNTDTNNFDDDRRSKLDLIESGATADQSAAEIKSAYESNVNTNEFSDLEKAKLAGIQEGATASGGASGGTTVTVSSPVLGIEDTENPIDAAFTRVINLPSFPGFTLTALTADDLDDNQNLSVAESVTDNDGNGRITLTTSTALTTEFTSQVMVNATYSNADATSVEVAQTFNATGYLPWFTTGVATEPTASIANTSNTRVARRVTAADPDKNWLIGEFTPTNGYVIINAPSSIDFGNLSLSIGHVAFFTAVELTGAASTGYTSWCIGDGTSTTEHVAITVGNLPANTGNGIPGARGPQGADGVSPVISAITTDTESGATIQLQQTIGTAAATDVGNLITLSDGLGGEDGADGRTLLNGTTPPLNTLGVDGDFYINTTANEIYGPKSSGSWQPSGVSIIGSAGMPGSAGRGITSITGPMTSGLVDTYTINYSDSTTFTYTVTNGANGGTGGMGPRGFEGPEGRTVLNGGAAPVDGDGDDGDFYLQIASTTSRLLFGPKDETAVAGSQWGTGVELVGTDGTGLNVSADSPSGTVLSTAITKIIAGTNVTFTEVSPNEITINATVNAPVAPPTAVFNGRITSTVANSVNLGIGGIQIWPLVISHNNGFTYSITDVQVPTGWASSGQTATAVDVQAPTTSVSNEEVSGVIRIAGTYTETSTSNVGSFELSITLRSFIPWYATTTSSATVPTILSEYTSQGSFDSPEEYVVAAVTNDYAQIAIPTHFGTAFRFTVSGFSAAADSTNTTNLSGYTVFTFGPLTSTIPTPITITR